MKKMGEGVHQIQEQIVSVGKVIPQERSIERIVKQIDVFRPREVVEEFVKLVQTFPQKRCHHGIVPTISNQRLNFATNSGANVDARTVEDMSFIFHERLQQLAVEEC